MHPLQKERHGSETEPSDIDRRGLRRLRLQQTLASALGGPKYYTTVPNGLAAAGREPYATVVPQLVEAWLAWAAEHLEAEPGQRRAEATAAVALIDGLLLLRRLAGPAAAEAAAMRLGVSPG